MISVCRVILFVGGLFNPFVRRFAFYIEVLNTLLLLMTPWGHGHFLCLVTFSFFFDAIPGVLTVNAFAIVQFFWVNQRLYHHGTEQLEYTYFCKQLYISNLPACAMPFAIMLLIALVDSVKAEKEFYHHILSKMKEGVILMSNDLDNVIFANESATQIFDTEVMNEDAFS